jgi:hypothetical protein
MDAQSQQPSQAEFQSLWAEAMFWKQKYFEQLKHSNEVIAALSRPSAPPDHLMAMLGGQMPTDQENTAQNGAQPQQSAAKAQPNRAARRQSARKAAPSK